MNNSGSIRATLYLVLLLSLIPATGLLVYSGAVTRQEAMRSKQLDGDIKMRLIAMQQNAVLENTYTQIVSLSQREEVLRLDAEAVRELLNQIALRNEFYDNIYVADASGKVIAAARDFRAGVSVRESPIFRDALLSGRFSGGALAPDPFTGARVLPFASPAWDENGDILAVTIFSVDEVLSATYLDGLLQGPETTLLVMDSAGSVVFAYPPESADEVDHSAIWDELQAVGGSTGFFISGPDGGYVNAFLRMYLSHALPESEEKPVLTTHMRQPTRLAHAEVDAALYRNLALLGAALLASISIVWLLGSTGLVKATGNLLNVAGRIAAGQLGARSSTTGLTGDFVRLAASLDAMAESLEKRKQDLVKAKNEALAANRAKSEFLSSMSHGIRTPMNSIIGMAYLILKTELTPKQKAYLNKIYGAANNLLGIINDILDFSKIESGQFSMDESPFSIDELMDDISTLIYQRAEEKNLYVRFSVAPDVPSVLVGDSMRLGQVLTNLAGNAVKFTEQGGVSINCRLLEKRDRQVKLSFSVRDTGIGMTSEQISKLFQAFTQADGSTTRKFGGTGLGLAISKRLVDLMRGNIYIKSQPGEGTTVEATVWLRAQDEDERGALELAKTFAGFPVLLIDDNKETGHLFEAELAQLGLRVDRAKTAEEGFNMLSALRQGAQYRLVCLELFMKDMDGPDMARHIREKLKLGKVPPLLFTTSAPYGPELQARCEESGALGIVHKPMTRQFLVQILDNAFKGRPVSAPSGNSGPVQLPQINPLRGLRILLAEDNPVNQQVAVELLQDAGALVKVAGNGVDAVNILNATLKAGESFDMLLLDLQMPQMDGYEVARLIRADERFNSMPIIAMTAHAMAEERQKCLDYGMNDHIAKPLEVSKFYETLLKWSMSRKRPNGSTAQAGPNAAAPEKYAQADPTGEALPELVGLNPAALARLGGNTELYKKLLTQFVDFYKDMDDNYRKALQEGDNEGAVRIAHTLKGLASSIGADDLTEAARDLETALRRAAPDSAAQADKCFELLAGVQAAINGVLRLSARAGRADGSPASVAEEEAPAPDAEAFQALMERLLYFLRDDDAEAAAFFEENRSAFTRILPRRRFSALEQALTHFEFDEALKILEEDKQGDA